MNNLIKLLAFSFAFTLTLIGCDSTSTDLTETGTLQLLMQADITNSQAAKQLQIVQKQEGITITEVKLFIEEMELESVENDSLDFEIENFIVNLPLDGSPLVLTEQIIPAGIYDEFELEIEKPDDDVIVSDPDFRDETGSYSVVIKGMYNGEEFTFRSSEDFEIEIDIDPPLELNDSESTSLIINVDVSSWFKDANGNDLDPKDFANTELINENIENSFEAFEDQFDDDDDDDN